MRLRRRRRVVIVAAVVALGCALGMSAASGAPAPTTGKTSAAHAEKVARQKVAKRVAAQSDDFGIRGPRIPSDEDIVGEVVYDAVQAGTSATVARSKTTLALPPSVVLTYIQTCGKSLIPDADGNAIPSYYCCPNAETQGCNPDFIVQTPATNADGKPVDTSSDFSVNWTRLQGPLWAASPPGSPRPYGIFPPTTVKLLAFGSVPATATVHISQPVTSSGSVVPLNYYDLTLGPTPIGVEVAGFPGVKDQNSTLITQRYLRGPVDVRLDNVRVDGRLVDVGSNCAATGAQLNYEAPRGETDPNADPTTLAGRPGEFNPLSGGAPAGQGNASITIPSFHGCRDERASLDPLVTNLASGKSLVQLKLRSGAYDCTNADNPLQGCPRYPGYDAPINNQPTALIRALKKMPARSAKNLVASLPQDVRRELPARLR